MSYFHRIKGAVQSGKKAAYLGIFLYAISPITHIIDKVLIYAFGKKNTDKKPLLIILSCPPRSGSTVIFQYLTRSLSVNYPSNVHYLFPRNGSRILKLMGQNPSKWHSFKNYYGYTPYFSDVNEGNYFFNGLENDKEMSNQLETFTQSISTNNQAVLCKTVSSFEKLSRIYKAYPNSIFIRIRRNLNQNIQSELAAYYELKSFNPIPKSLQNIDFNQEPAKFATMQILKMNDILDQEFSKIPKQNSLSISYESFCENPEIHINDIINSSINIGNTEIERKGYNTSLKASSRRKVSENDLEIIRKELEGYAKIK